MTNIISILNKRIQAFRNPRIFLTNRGSVMDNIIPFFFATSINKAKVAVLFQDVVGNGLKFATEAKEKGIPIVVVQHGRGAIRDYLPPFNHKLLADKICVWGTRDHEMMIKGGFSPESVILTGCPLFDGLSNKRNTHKGINILFAPAHNTYINKEIDENLEIIFKLRSINGINLFSKLLTMHKKQYYGKGAIVSNSFDNDHLLKCIRAVKHADILVSNQSGTIELIAMYFGVPVIFVANYGNLNESYTKGTYRIESVEELPNAIEKVLEDSSLLENEINEVLLRDAGIGLPGSPILKIIETIKGLVK